MLIDSPVMMRALQRHERAREADVVGSCALPSRIAATAELRASAT